MGNVPQAPVENRGFPDYRVVALVSGQSGGSEVERRCFLCDTSVIPFQIENFGKMCESFFR